MTEPQWLDQQEMAAWNAFLEASHLVERRVEKQLRDQEGLSHPQYEILVRLSGAPNGEVRMTELADHMVTSKSGLTYQVGRLEKAGLVRRRSSSTDDRGVYAVLTETGRRKINQVAPGHVAVVRSSLIDILGQEQLATLAEVLDIVSHKLRAGVETDRSFPPSG